MRNLYRYSSQQPCKKEQVWLKIEQVIYAPSLYKYWNFNKMLLSIKGKND